jgi:hypothetical protein
VDFTLLIRLPNRDYTTTVKNVLPASWNAPKFVTPENKDLVGGIQTDSTTPLDPLLGMYSAWEQRGKLIP